MKGMAMVKAKDLVLLSVASKLPTAADEPAPGKPVADKLQIFAATTSVDHERVPATPAYNRMQLSVSGFLIEEVGAGGSKIVQITDLSGLGCASPLAFAPCATRGADAVSLLAAWIPGAVLRTITQTMLPKSLVKLGVTAAATTDLTADFPPPTLGVYAASSSTAAAADDDSDDDDDDEVSSGYDSDSDASSSSSNPRTGPSPSSDLVPASSSALSSPAAARDVSFLLAQLRSITSRLAALETLVAGPNAASSGRSGRPWYALGLGSGARGAGSPQRKITGGAAGGETGTALLGPGTLGALATLGSAAAAAVAVAAVAAWGKRRR